MKARRPGESLLLLLDLADVFDAHQIDYIAIGAIAASVHGIVRATTDADALVSTTASGLAKLEKALRQSGLTTDLREGDVEDPIRAVLAVTDEHGNRVDIISGLRGLDPGAFTRAITVSFQKKSLRVAGREDFIAMKCFAAGPQDLVDARETLQAVTPDQPMDIDLLRVLVLRFGRAAADQLERLLGSFERR